MNDKEWSITSMMFNNLFDQAMIRALKSTYEVLQISDEQIIKSWEHVRQRLDDVASNTHGED